MMSHKVKKQGEGSFESSEGDKSLCVALVQMYSRAHQCIQVQFFKSNFANLSTK